MSDKIYVGSAKAIKTKNGGILKVSFNQADLAMMQNHLNEKGWVNLDVTSRKAVSEYGHTHKIEIDTWKAEQKQQEPQSNYEPSMDQHKASKGFDEDIMDADLPF